MSIKKANFLIVDDEASLRAMLVRFFAECGYQVRSAEDGFSALAKIRSETPDIILSDLDMPGMSGFELLSVVRRRFPAVQTIAMSGAFSGEGVPPGVAADAFYKKGSNLADLLQIADAMSRPDRSQTRHSQGVMAPIWIPKNGHNSLGKSFVVITCPECLRTFTELLGESNVSVQKTGCVYCGNSIHYAIVQSHDPGSISAYQRHPGADMPTALSLPKIH